ncbi:uncharacterized protein LOC122249905 isoform X2 [Penaeus japonicus]|nr:uncharacterized protein LOC122249905 isoform X2 [Penaeus japonicus]
MSQPLKCSFCGREDENEVEFGKLYTVDEVSVHYFCLLFSSGLAQNGEDNEGILGFLADDIVKEIQRGRKLSCCYCLRKGATIGCYNKKCRRTYHYPCGVKQNALCKFSDDFRSYCSQHREYQKGFGAGEELECPICMEELIANSQKAIWAPCCKRKTWFHKECLQRLALSAGYFFKCPLCNDKDVFQLEMQNLGIFVPEKDASWELEPNAFSELLERPIHCDAPKCKCPDGRKTDVEGTRWEVLLCNLCGSTGVHIQCGGLPFVCTEWNCPTCVNMLSESFKRTQQEERQRRLKERKNKISENEDLTFDSPQSCSSTAASGSIALDRHVLTPGKRKREDVETGMETPPKLRHMEGMETFSKITYASDSDEEIDVESGEYQVPPHTNIRELEELGEELPKKLVKLKNHALRAQERMQELRLTEADIVRIAKEAAQNNDIALDKSQVTRFFRYKLPLEKMLQIAELIRKVFAFREAMVQEAQSSSSCKKKGSTPTPSRRGRRKSGTPTIKIPLLKTAISQSLITTGISAVQKEKPVNVEEPITKLPGSWSMHSANRTIGKLSSGFDIETDAINSKLDSIREALCKGKERKEVPEKENSASVERQCGDQQESKDSIDNNANLESETELTLFLSPLSSQGSVGSKICETEKRMNKENEDINQDEFQSPLARRKLLLNPNNQITKETAEPMSPGEGVTTTIGLSEGNTSSKRYVWRNSMHQERKALMELVKHNIPLENQWKPLREKIEDALKLEEQSNQGLDDLDFEELSKSSENCVSDFETENFENMLSLLCLPTLGHEASGSHLAVEYKARPSVALPPQIPDGEDEMPVLERESRYVSCGFAKLRDHMPDLEEGCAEELQRLPDLMAKGSPILEERDESNVGVATLDTNGSDEMLHQEQVGNAHGNAHNMKTNTFEPTDTMQQDQVVPQAKCQPGGSSQMMLRNKRKRRKRAFTWKHGLKKGLWGWYSLDRSSSIEIEEKESAVGTGRATPQCKECSVALERLPPLDKAWKIKVCGNAIKIRQGRRVKMIFMKKPGPCT